MLLAHEILADFIRTRGLRCVREGASYRIGRETVTVVDGAVPCAGTRGVEFLVDEQQPRGRYWYNLVTLRHALACTGRFHRQLQEHCRKYFGMHFLPMDQGEL